MEPVARALVCAACLGATACPAAEGTKLPKCDDTTRVELPRASSKELCGEKLLVDALQAHSPVGTCLTAFKETAATLNKEGFGFRVVYRPSRREDEGRILEVNPHLRNDVRVCTTHEVDVYVGRWPFREMPDVTGNVVSQAMASLTEKGFNPEARCTTWEPAKGRNGWVVQQWPQPNKLLGRSATMSRFEMEEQQPLLVVACDESPPPPAGPQPPCSSCPPPPPPPPDPASAADAALGGVAGLAGGLLLARVLQRSPTQPPAPRDTLRPNVIARVRHDLDPGVHGESDRDPGRS